MGESRAEALIEVGCGAAAGDDSRRAGQSAAQQALGGIRRQPLSCVLVFASVRFDLEAMLGGVHDLVGDVPVIGATTAGEICDRLLTESVVVLALASPHLSVQAVVGRQVSQDWRRAVAEAIGQDAFLPCFASEDDAYWRALTRQGRSAFGLLFSPGNTRLADSRSREILEEFKRRSRGRLPIVGGSAADDWRMQQNYVLCGRQAYPDSLLLALFETRLRFGLGLAHGFSPTDRRATVTRALGHEVLELDGQPAAEVYARLLGHSPVDLAGKHLTLTTATPAGTPDPYGQYSVNVASYFTDQGGVRFAQPLAEGTTLCMMQADVESLVEAGADALRKALLRGGITEPAAVLTFSCALRSRILGERTNDEVEAVKGLAAEGPVVGFQSFGEQGITDDGVNRHGNEVISTLVLGSELTHAAEVALENEQLFTERSRATEALRSSQQRYRALFAGITDAVYVHRVTPQGTPGRFVEVNDVACRMLGYSREELLELSLLDIDAPESEVDTKAVGEQLLSGQDVLFEQLHLAKDGRRIPMEIHALWFEYQGQGAVLSVARDISERKRAHEELQRWIREQQQAEQALRASEERFRTVVQSLDDVVYTLDAEQRHTGVFGTWADSVGMGAGAFLGKTAREILGAEAAVVHEAANRRALRGEHVVYEWSVVGPDQRERWYQTALCPMRAESGEVTGIAGVGREITQLKRAEQDLKDYADTQAVLLREVNHRVKNNLSAIMGMLHMEGDRASEEGKQDCARLLRSITARIEGLSAVHSLLSARGWRPLNLAHLCQEVTRCALQAAAPTSQVGLAVEPSPVEVDSNQAHQLTLVVHELAMNSLKHALPGRPRVEISIRVWQQEAMTHLEYRDDGPGYPEALLIGDRCGGGVGFELVEGIVSRSLRGQLRLGNAQGAVAHLAFPTSTPATPEVGA